MSTILQTTATRTIHPERILNYTAKSMFLLREVAIHCTISFKSEASTRMESHLLCGFFLSSKIYVLVARGTQKLNQLMDLKTSTS
jgi:hypothetical protein